MAGDLKGPIMPSKKQCNEQGGTGNHRKMGREKTSGPQANRGEGGERLPSQDRVPVTGGGGLGPSPTERGKPKGNVGNQQKNSLPRDDTSSTNRSTSSDPKGGGQR